MNKETVNISIYQSSARTLIDAGIWGTIQDMKAGKMTLPAKYYQKVFTGEIELELQEKLQDGGMRLSNILDQVFNIFYEEHPKGYLGRNMWTGDVVELDGKFYLCKPVGFQECEFTPSDAATKQGISPETIKRAEQVLIDNGIDPDEAQTVLQALGYVLLNEELYPED